MNILVTGGLGFIGHNFIKYIFNNFEFNLLINIDKISYCSNKSFIINDNKYKFVKADINDKNLICFILKEYNVTHVIHFAAQSHVDNSFDNSLDYTIDNVMGTHTLLDCVKNVNKEILFLHFSTDEVYGELAKLIINKDDISEYIEYVNDRPFNDKRYEINSDKLKKLGWKVEVLNLMHTIK